MTKQVTEQKMAKQVIGRTKDGKTVHRYNGRWQNSLQLEQKMAKQVKIRTEDGKTGRNSEQSRWK